ncbi:motile sperm domain-containing protein 2-like [Pollicipes pollicipes]|uniref:motile sperm domain-containing protein 2-like n=1 Tax=Pollicipes pollicipes TaxID=41117 RepID=UPI00188498A7|nr:motile sperm domain-containing protein 2-like [Pollicipes pollicipes]
MDKALNFMIDAVKFRKEMCANDISLDTVDNTLFSKGVMCTHGQDKKGCRIAIFNARFHERVSGARFEDVKKFLVFWIEKVDREEKGKRISLFFDMGNAGMSNVDIPFISYLVNLFKFYYPDMLNNIMVFELPFIMTAAWKIVKNMLPAKSHQLIKFVSKKDANTLVPAECLLTRWGGEDSWAYSFDPEECAMPPLPFLGAQATGAEDKPKVNGVANGHAGGKMANGHVRSSQKSSQGHDSAAKYLSVKDPPSSPESGHKVRFPDDVSTNSDELSDSKLQEDSSTAELGKLLEVTPGEQLWFGSSKTKQTITLSNIRRAGVAFKVKTTSPDKFRVRPSSGVVPTGRRVVVELELCDGVTPQHVVTDRFLILAAGVPHERVPARDMGRLWRSLPSGDKLEHCLRCAAAPALNDPLMALVRGLGTRLEAVSQRLEKQQQLATETEQQYAKTRRRLGVALALIAATAVANLCLALTVTRC